MQLQVIRKQYQVVLDGKYHVTFQVIKDGECVAECGGRDSAYRKMDELWDARPMSDRIMESLYRD